MTPGFVYHHGLLVPMTDAADTIAVNILCLIVCQGAVSGLGKGVVGTVTKPVAGVLDFASGTASAIRDTSKSHIHRRPARVRRPRCCYGHGGLLTPYSMQSAEAQEELYQLNNHNYAEQFVAFIIYYNIAW